jgi:hypothetical protein
MRRCLFLLALALALPALAACQPAAEPPTPSPEVFIGINQAIPDFGITLQGVHLAIAGATLAGEFPAGCSAGSSCVMAKPGFHMLTVTFAPRDLPQGDMLAYKQLPAVSVALEGGATIPQSARMYDNTSRQLSLGFEVPENAKTFGLRWADLTEIPLNVEVED